MKTIETIKDNLAMELGFESWKDYEDCSIIEGSDVTEVAQRYAQQYIDANKELYIEQLEEYASFQVLIKSMEDRIKDLQQSNKELVEMLDFIFYKTNFQNHFPTTSIKVKNLISKYTTNDAKK